MRPSLINRTAIAPAPFYLNFPVVLLTGCPKKRSMVTLSSTEAELLSLSEAARELLWWQRFFRDLQYTGYAETSGRPTILCDNWQTIRP